MARYNQLGLQRFIVHAEGQAIHDQWDESVDCSINVVVGPQPVHLLLSGAGKRASPCQTTTAGPQLAHS